MAVIGAGVFGAWTALHLARGGRRVALLDAHGPGNRRASSAGETRVLRAGYGPDRIYSRWARRSREAWRELEQTGGETLYHETGVLWLARGEDPIGGSTLAALAAEGVPHERLTGSVLTRRWPQFAVAPDEWAIFEPDSGVLLARRAVRAVVGAAVAAGVAYRQVAIAPPRIRRGRAAVATTSGEPLAAGCFVLACGPWLPQLLPRLLGPCLFPTRQEVFYFGPPPGDRRFAPPAMPAWLDFGAEVYGLPDMTGTGVKVASDRHGPPFDPEHGERLASAAAAAAARAYLAHRLPLLAAAPIVASEVCQYENTGNGDFLIDRHPDAANLWLVGGGSGHGFKHGPAVGAYAAALLAGEAAPELRFQLASKSTVHRRAVH